MAKRQTSKAGGASTRVAVYARFSCDKQRDESIEDQLYEAERYCERKGYEIVKAYTDYAISGRSDDRPQFQQMIEDAETSAFDVVLVWKMDRFARNMQDQFFHEKVLNDCGVRLESIKENISGNGIEASMSKGMHAIFAQIRSQQSAEDTMRGMLGKARKCQYLGYKWFGYSHDGDLITLDPIEAPIAEEIHMRYLRGWSIAAIRSWLIDEGVKTSTGSTPSYNFVNDILKSRRYVGEYTWGFQKDANGRKLLDAHGKPIPLVCVPGGIPAIVSEAVKQRCIDLLSYGKHYKGKAEYLLSGKMLCTCCNQLMRGESARNHAGVEYFRYTCKGQRKACLGVFWKDDTEHAIAQSVRAALGDSGTRELIAEKFAEYQGMKKPDATITTTKSDIKALRKQRDNLMKAIEDGMPYAQARDRLADIEEKMAKAESKLADLERPEKTLQKNDVLEVLNLISKGFRTDAELINTFITQVLLYETAAIAVFCFNDDNSTVKREIEGLVRKYEPAGQAAGSYNLDWLTR